MTQFSTNVLRKHNITPDSVIYPGHPVTLALCIVERFATYEEAFFVKEKRTHISAAAGSVDIPGSGGNVCVALELLHSLRSGVPFNQAVNRADAAWARCDSQKIGGGSFAKDEAHRQRFTQRWKNGQDQADQVKPLLSSCVSWWTQAK